MGFRVKRVRRRGKPLVPTTFIDFLDERNQRCNVDFEFLMCAPDDAANATQALQRGGAVEPASAASEPALRRRLTKKTAPKKTSGATKVVLLRRCNNGGKK